MFAVIDWRARVGDAGTLARQALELAAAEGAFFFFGFLLFLYLGRIISFSDCGVVSGDLSLFGFVTCSLLISASVALLFIVALRILREHLRNAKGSGETFRGVVSAVGLVAFVSVAGLFVEESALAAGAPLLQQSDVGACRG